MNALRLSLSIALLSALVSQTSAAVIGVDVGDAASVYNGAGVLDPFIRTWENVADGTPTFSLLGDTITYSTTATGEFNRSGTFSGTIDLFEDGEFGGTSGSQTVTLSGLRTDGTTYDLALYASQGDLARGATFNIGGDIKVAAGVANSTTFILNGNYVLYTDLTPNISGEISWTYSIAGGDAAYVLNGFELSAVVPEPSSLLLVGLGVAGFGVRRRRRRQGNREQRIA